jgi:hypothetical protein
MTTRNATRQGGSYLHRKDGSIQRTAFTAPAPMRLRKTAVASMAPPVAAPIEETTTSPAPSAFAEPAQRKARRGKE